MNWAHLSINVDTEEILLLTKKLTQDDWDNLSKNY